MESYVITYEDGPGQAYDICEGDDVVDCLIAFADRHPGVTVLGIHDGDNLAEWADYWRRITEWL